MEAQDPNLRPHRVVVPASPSSKMRHALARSRVRQRVLRALLHQSPQYLSEIAAGTGLGIQNVAGALRGHGQRYSPDLSLKGLGMVDEETDSDLRLRVFRLTPLGRDVALAMKERRDAWTGF